MTNRNSENVPYWALHRKLYLWLLSLAHHRHAFWALFLLSFAESSFFPLAPDILLIALSLEKPEKSFQYASVTTIGSVFGGVFGYFIGSQFWYYTSDFFLSYVFSEKTFNDVNAIYHRWDFWAILTAAFTPIPYKVFTISAGVFGISLPKFILASVIGRGARFFIVAGLIRIYGQPIKTFIDRYFNLLSIALIAILATGFWLLSHI